MFVGFAIGAFLLCGYSGIFAGEQTKQTETKEVSLFTILGQSPCTPAQRWSSSTGVSESSIPGFNGSSSNGYRTDSQRLFAGGSVTPRGAAIGMETFGDFFGGGIGWYKEDGERWASYGASGAFPSEGGAEALPGATVGRIKIVENFNPMPVDRLIFDYNFFYNTPLTEEGVNVNRFTPGIEKTLFGGMSSIEVRLPMAFTLASDDSERIDHYEFGNMMLTFKQLLVDRRKTSVSAGLSLALPTARNFVSDDIRVENKSVHYMPFIAFQYKPNREWFTQLYYQLDVDGNGNPVFEYTENPPGSGNRVVDDKYRVYDATYQYVSASVGRWLYRDNTRRQGLTGMNVSGEVHWSTILNRGHDFDVVNATVGTRMIFGHRTSLGVAYCVPLTQTRQFDGELRITLNRYF